MLAHIMSEATSTRARRLATYTATTIGGAWLVGKYAVNMLVQGAETSRKEAAEKYDLANRFGLALQDAEFTVLALAPTLATQLSEQLDVEARSRELADIAKRERDEKTRAAAAAAAKQEADERAKAEEEAQHSQPVQSQEGSANPSSEETAATAATAQVDGDAALSPVNGSSPSPAPAPESAKSPSALSPPSLNPAAPAFQPRFAPVTSPSPPSPVELAPSTPKPEDFPSLPNGHTVAEKPDEASSPTSNGPGAHESVHDAESLANVGKSWAEIVKENAPSAENGADDLSGGAVKKDVEQVEKDSEKPRTANQEVEGNARTESDEVAQSPQLEEALPKKTKAELWHEIKTLSFTRLVTSIYVLVLLTLQTHVQLALLGRASYVSSLLSTLPPRSPSPPRYKRLHNGLDKASSKPSLAETDLLDGDVDLERALYDAKQLPLKAEDEDEQRRDVERKYLTFSWWLLHEGWKLVEKRVEEAVEAVVGPMGLKAPLVYGELGALFGEIRRRVEQNEDGSLFDFSAALHPPTFDLELQTLIAGGSYVPSPPASPPAASSSSSHDFPLSQPCTPPPRHHRRDPIPPALRTLLHETSDALDSPDAALVRALSLDALFALLLQRLEPAFTGNASTPSGDGDRGARFEDVSEKTTRLASLLPFVTKLAGTTGVERGVLSSGVNGNEFVEALEDVRELREFCAVLYGSWDRDDLRTSCAL
ncbi:hypothetical protein JCM8115_002086 [Rhodotorula mucilaginosa]